MSCSYTASPTPLTPIALAEISMDLPTIGVRWSSIGPSRRIGSGIKPHTVSQSDSVSAASRHGVVGRLPFTVASLNTSLTSCHQPQPPTDCLDADTSTFP